jgi:hypothetical protein
MKYDEIIKLISGISKSLSESIAAIDVIENLKSKFQMNQRKRFATADNKRCCGKRHLNSFWKEFD